MCPTNRTSRAHFHPLSLSCRFQLESSSGSSDMGLGVIIHTHTHLDSMLGHSFLRNLNHDPRRFSQLQQTWQRCCRCDSGASEHSFFFFYHSVNLLQNLKLPSSKYGAPSSATAAMATTLSPHPHIFLSQSMSALVPTDYRRWRGHQCIGGRNLSHRSRMKCS